VFCAGYASLFEKLAAEAGLTAAVIGGFSKGYGYQQGAEMANSDQRLERGPVGRPMVSP